MRSLKCKNGYYINDFSSYSVDKSWQLLVSYLKSNSFNYFKANFDEEEKTISITSKDESKFIDLIKKFDPSGLIQQKLIRTMKLNVAFDKVTKNLVISNDNVENFPESNTITYSISCNELSDDNNLYFHETALVNNYESYKSEDLKQCSYVLGIVFFDGNYSIFNKETQNIVNNDFKDEMHFVCVNKDTGKIEVIDFSYLNKDSFFNYQKFIEDFNNGTSIDEANLGQTIETDEEIKIYNFENIRFIQSKFILMNGEETDFINFKSYSSSYLFNTFIANLKKNATNI